MPQLFSFNQGSCLSSFLHLFSFSLLSLSSLLRLFLPIFKLHPLSFFVQHQLSAVPLFIMTPGVLLQPFVKWFIQCQENPSSARSPFNGPGGWDFDFVLGKPYLECHNSEVTAFADLKKQMTCPAKKSEVKTKPKNIYSKMLLRSKAKAKPKLNIPIVDLVAVEAIQDRWNEKEEVLYLAFLESTEVRWSNLWSDESVSTRDSYERWWQYGCSGGHWRLL